MKKFIISFCSLALLSLIYFSCSKDVAGPSKNEGTVEFGFSLKAPSHGGAQKSSMMAAAEPAAVVVSIKKANGSLAYTMQRVELYSMNGYYISKPLSLLPGNYTVEQFFVVDAAGNVVYASPVQGSPKAYLVSKPLPISFSVGKDVVTKIVPEVLSTAGSTPEDFGYTTFSFDVVKTFDFLIGVFVYNDSTANFELTTANLNIIADSKTIYSESLAAITNQVSVNDGYNSYFLTVTKNGFKTWVDTLTAAELKLYFRSEDKGPLKVILEKGCNCPPTVTDIDGNVYQTVVIGNQCWMKENLKTTKYNDGTAIPLVTHPTSWATLYTPAYCFYDDVEAAYKNTYGALYNWYCVNTGKLNPTGWHIPSDAEWTQLTDYLGGVNVADEKMKETGTTHWFLDSNATNESGFTALPGGYRSVNFGHIGSYGGWWSAIEYDTSRAGGLNLVNTFSNVFRFKYNKFQGMSVRCLKD